MPDRASPGGPAKSLKDREKKGRGRTKKIANDQQKYLKRKSKNAAQNNKKGEVRPEMGQQGWVLCQKIRIGDTEGGERREDARKPPQKKAPPIEGSQRKRQSSTNKSMS